MFNQYLLLLSVMMELKALLGHCVLMEASALCYCVVHIIIIEHILTQMHIH